MTSKLRPAYSLLRASHESANSFVLQKSLHAFDVFVEHQLYSHYLLGCLESINLLDKWGFGDSHSIVNPGDPET